jgi:hypothetical protein
MAIQFLNDLALNQNELIQPVLENKPNNAGVGTGIEGQLYFDTTADVVKVWAGGAWAEVGGGVISLTLNDGTYIDVNSTGTATNPVFAPDLSAVDGNSTAASRFLTKDNTWAVPTDLFSGWKLNVTGGTQTTIQSNDEVVFAHGTFLQTTIGTVGAISTITTSLSATGTKDATTYLAGDNTFKAISTIPGLYNSWNVAASNGTTRDVETTDTVSLTATDGMSSTVSAGAGQDSIVNFVNTDKGSSQFIFKNFTADGGGTATASTNNDTLTIAGGANITTARAGDVITITGGEGYSGWFFDGDTGTAQEVDSGETAFVLGGTKMSTAIGGTRSVSVTHDNTSRTDTAPTVTLTNGGTFIAETSTTQDATGHVTSVAVTTYTLPTSTVGTVTEVDAGAGLVTNPTAGITDTGTVSINYTGAANAILTPGTAVAASADQIIFNDVTASNAVKKTTLATIPVTAVTAIKTYIDNATTGALVFQGGYNAGTNTPELDSRGTGPITVEKGWTYAVTDVGTFYGEVVEAGDLLIAEVDNAAALASWTVVQANIGVAGSGATDGATTKGISGYFNGDFNITANGFVTLVKPPSSTTKNILLNSSVTGVSVDTSTAGITKYVIDLSAAWATGIESENVMCEVRGTSSAGTGLAYHQVFTSVLANANDILTIEFKGAITEGHYRALLVNVE